MSLQDIAVQFTRKSGGSAIKVRQVVPGLKWEVVPTPVVEVSAGTRVLCLHIRVCERQRECVSFEREGGEDRGGRSNAQWSK